MNAERMYVISEGILKGQPIVMSSLPEDFPVYLAGPMTGCPHFNQAAFDSAGDMMAVDWGMVVFNPANNSGFRKLAAVIPDGDERKAIEQFGFNRRLAISNGLQWICSRAQGIAMLPGWQQSTGAVAEYSAAIACGLIVFVLQEIPRPRHASDEPRSARKQFPFYGRQ